MIDLNKFNILIDVACIIILSIRNNYKVAVFNNANREQDAEYTRRKKHLISKRTLAKNQTEKIIKSQVVKKQDHSTLLNSTEVWIEKCRMRDLNTKDPRKLQYIKDVPRLYVF